MLSSFLLLACILIGYSVVQAQPGEPNAFTILHLTPSFPLNIIYTFWSTPFIKPTKQQIAQQFRQLSKLHHPDKNKGGDSTHFTLIADANDRLSDEEFAFEEYVRYNQLLASGSILEILSNGCSVTHTHYRRIFFLACNAFIVVLATFLYKRRVNRLVDEIEEQENLRRLARENASIDKEKRLAHLARLEAEQKQLREANEVHEPQSPPPHPVEYPLIRGSSTTGYHTVHHYVSEAQTFSRQRGVASATLVKILRNLVNVNEHSIITPANQKFFSLSLTSKNFKNDVYRFVPFRDLMTTLGFSLQDDNSFAMSFPPHPRVLRLIVSATQFLQNLDGLRSRVGSGSYDYDESVLGIAKSGRLTLENSIFTSNRLNELSSDKVSERSERALRFEPPPNYY